MISVMCSSCTTLVILPITQEQFSAVKIFGTLEASELKLSPEQEFFVASGVCSECDYLDANIEVKEVA